jgi:hypothetical protein
MANSFTPAKTGYSRVFLIEGRARGDHRPSYQSNMKAGGISQSFGDVTKIEVPSATQFNKFVEIGSIIGETERMSISLMSRYALDLKSTLLRLAREGCAVDIQIVLGSCTDPSDYNVFTKKVVIEDARITQYDTDDMGALGSDEREKIDETVEVSGRDVYEIMPVAFAQRAGDTVTNEMVDAVIADTASCGDCDEESNGCEKMFAVSLAAGGSPSTPADVVFSLDTGSTWYAHDVDSLGSSDDPTGIFKLGSYIAVISSDSESLHYALYSDFDGTTDPTFTEVSTGFVASSGPTAASVGDQKAFIAGLAGHIYMTQDVTSGVTAVETGSVTISDFNDISALSDDFVVAVGNDGVIAKTENGSSFTLVTPPTGVGVGVDINAVAVKSTSVWWIGTNAGKLYYTINGGSSWTEKTFYLSGTGSVEDIALGGETVMAVSHTTAGGNGRLLISTNGGYDFIVAPQGTGTLPVNDRINAVAVCAHNPDVIVGVGLADDGSDGYIVVGTD